MVTMKQTIQTVVPETFDGWAILHEVFRINWATWKNRPKNEREQTISQAQTYLEKIAKPKEGESACFSLLGHKGDLLLLHFRKTFDELNSVELGFRQLLLMQDLEETTSYLSIVELGLYEMTVKLHERLVGEGLDAGTDAWNEKWETEMSEQRERIKNRLFPQIPPDRYLCFYPMSKRRGEKVNWYQVPIKERQRMMRDHGMIGRKYAGQVTQIISGSIGYDDWEWGVDLFAKDPKVFKKLIYEMRFDEASSGYAEFGPFYSALRFDAKQLERFFQGELPKGF